MVSGALVGLVSATPVMVFPVPLVVAPVIEPGVAVQENSAPVVVELKVIVLKMASEQMVCGTGEKVTFGAGLMVTVTLKVSPAQPSLEVGVTVYVAVTASAVVLVNTCPMED